VPWRLDARTLRLDRACLSGAGLPASIRFRFESKLESPAYVFLAWGDP
jgi:hypothetical protein